MEFPSQAGNFVGFSHTLFPYCMTGLIGSLEC